MAYPDMEKFVPLMKVEDDPTDGLAIAAGIATAEIPDKDREICDFNDTVPLYRAWSEEAFKATSAAGQEPSLGNVRIMHGLEAGGKVTKLDFQADKKQIWIVTKAKDEAVSRDLRAGIYTGFSQGGKYIYRKCESCKTEMPQGRFCPRCEKQVDVRYAARPSEVSYVDSPCLGAAHFAYVKADGSTELRKFLEKKASCPKCDSSDMKAEKCGCSKCNQCGYERKCEACSAKKVEEVTALPSFTVEQLRAAARGEDAHLTDEQKIALDQFAEAVKARNPGGQFTHSAKGKTHEMMQGHGYEHSRVGSRTDPDSQPVQTAEYTHPSGGRVSLHGDGKWEHHRSGNTVTGHGADTLAAHLESVHGKPKASQKAENAKDDAKGKKPKPADSDNDDDADGDDGEDGDGKKVAKREYIDCPECDNRIPVPDDEEDFRCPECDAELEIDEDGDVHAKAQGGALRAFLRMAGRKFRKLAEKKPDTKPTPKGSVRKSMYTIGSLAAVLQQIKMMQMETAWEAANEPDERDARISQDLQAWIAQGVKILKDVVEDETSELTAANKAVLKGAIEMNPITVMVKAAHKNMASFYKMAAEAHEKMVAVYSDAMAASNEMALAFKAKVDAFNAEGSTDLQKAEHTFDKAQQEQQEKFATFNEAMVKNYSLLSAEAKKLAGEHEAAEAAVKDEELPAQKAEPVDLKPITDVLAGLPELIKTTVNDALGKQLEKSDARVVPPAKDLQLVRRPGEESQTEVAKADAGASGGL
jgi:hypothetical protein